MIENVDHNVQYLNIDMDLPDCESELKYAQDVLNKVRKRFELTQKAKNINDSIHEEYYEGVVRILDYVGHLSLPAFQCFEMMENAYFKAYPHAPALAKELWLKHYGDIHKPFNLIKNKCYKMLDEIDDEYIKRNRKTPPNWNP